MTAQNSGERPNDAAASPGGGTESPSGVEPDDASADAIVGSNEDEDERDDRAE
jgi:hypothetical protein